MVENIKDNKEIYSKSFLNKHSYAISYIDKNNEKKWIHLENDDVAFQSFNFLIKKGFKNITLHTANIKNLCYDKIMIA
jgi:hypothetical protein